MSNQAKAGIIPELNGLRGLACLMVLGVHFEDMAPGSTGLLRFLTVFQSQDWSGVDLFFVLSGFLIIGTLLDHEGKPGWIRSYFVARAFRLLPLYSLLLGIYSYFLYRHFSPPFFTGKVPTWSFFCFLHSWFAGLGNVDFPVFLSVTWSLAAEVHYYLGAAVLVIAVRKNRRPWYLAAAILLAWLVRVALIIYRPKFNFGYYILPIARMDGFAFGGCIALLSRSPEVIDFVRKYTRGILSMLGILLFGIFLFTVNEVSCYSRVAGLFGYAWFDVFYSLLLLLVLAKSGDRRLRLLARGPIPYIGLISYGVFLFQVPVKTLCDIFLGREYKYITRPAELAYPLAESALLIGVASLSWFLFEEPLIRVGRRLCAAQKRS
jgi:peptidoglycan/LPS O-acetylase OafA/YrhL